MISILFFMVFLTIYMAPGAYLARSLYSEKVKAIRTGPPRAPILPPRPERPEVKVNELLHTSGPVKKCSMLETSTRACNCSTRTEWLNTKNAWVNYNEWNEKYGETQRKIDAGVYSNTSISMVPVYLAIPFWPLVGVSRFVQGGVKNIPDYREIERMEKALEIEGGDAA